MDRKLKIAWWSSFDNLLYFGKDRLKIVELSPSFRKNSVEFGKRESLRQAFKFGQGPIIFVIFVPYCRIMANIL